MSYDYHDAAMDDMYYRLSQELYPAHAQQAIEEFTRARLRSYYLAHMDVLLPAGKTYKRAKILLDGGHAEASLVFSIVAVELFLKECLLRPVISGLIHSEAIADLVVDAALAQTGFKRYEQLLSGLFRELTGQNLAAIQREGAHHPVLNEFSTLQVRRNLVVHRGESIEMKEAVHAHEVAKAVFEEILLPVLAELDLSLRQGGILVDIAPGR